MANPRTVAALCLALVCACTDEASPAGASESAVDAASFHAWLAAVKTHADRGDDTWEQVRDGLWNALPLERVALRRSIAAWGDFGTLEIDFTHDRRATREGGMRDWPRSGDSALTAEVRYHEFARLCWLIEALDLPKRSASWSSGVTHAEHRTVTWTTRDGRSVELIDYGDAGPPEVATLAAAIENLARGLEWVE